MKRAITAMLFGMALSASVLAAIDTYEFGDEGARERFRQLTEELRCPKCQNQNIADSNAPIATDLRREIHRLLGEGKSDAEIVDFLVARYGDFVRYNPPVNARTWLLWYGPAGLLLGGLGVLGVIVVRRRRRELAPATQLGAAEQARLAALLKQHSPDIQD